MINKKSATLLTTLITGLTVYSFYHAQRINARKRSDKKIKEKNTKIKGITILGDSVARGYGSKIGGFGHSLAEMISRTSQENIWIKNFGIDGLTSKQLLEKINEGSFDGNLKESDLIIVNIGGNDLLELYKQGGEIKVIKDFFTVRSHFKTNLSLIFNKLSELNPDALIVFNTLYNPIKEDSEFYRVADILVRMWNGVLSRSNHIFVDTFSLSKADDIWSDEVHPNDLGYVELANLIYNRLTLKSP
ncbi:GDSL-type esterase/lipase family protein [Bacillus sp. Brlt_9]|uniref:GDSL-type esterase/lipase family protein n=1 Tax=Bacillus sp. Brlt_9 TaxID=3110916 RepID=UPI003F7CD092